MTTEQEITKLGQDWADAELRGDTTFLEGLLVDDYIGIGPFGYLLTKEQWLDRHASGDLEYSSFVWDEPQVRDYGDTAVVVGRQTANATYEGQEVPVETVRTMHIFVRQDGHWRLVGMQMSLMGPSSS